MLRRNLISAYMFLFIWYFIPNALDAQVPVQDSLALVALYDSTDGINWSNNTNWLSDQPVSSWSGITVTNGRVTAANLGNNNLKGTIPPSIGDLDSLELLVLFGNQLRDSIPSEIGSLSKLVELNLLSNELGGNIPPEIGNLTNLYHLNFSKNELSGSIPTEISNLINLDYLYLAYNQLSGSFPPELCVLLNLKHLTLQNNQLNGPIPVEIGNLTKLTGLNLSQNQLNDSIPVEIYNLRNLLNLNLAGNQLSGSIHTEIGNLKKLTSLSLSSNQLTGSIPTEIDSLRGLSTLSLTNNELTGPIPVEIGNLINLTELNLSVNFLNGSIPAEIGNLINLYHLYLNYNEFIETVPAQISNLTQLQYLAIDDNQLTDLPDLDTLTSLVDLWIQNNQFTFEDIETNVGVASGTFTYSPQDSVGEGMDTTITVGDILELSVTVGGTANQYQWMKDGADIPEATSSNYTISSAQNEDDGVYICKITNTIATDLTLYSRTFDVMVYDPTGMSELSEQIPREYRLCQNYPNPFNPSTRISYDIPRLEYGLLNVKITVYDMLGKKIKTLLNTHLPSGHYELQWDGTNTQNIPVPSGIYVYQFQSTQFNASKKMVLMQ